MTGYWQSPKRRAVSEISPFLKVRKQYRIRFWNVKTLLQTENLVQISKEIDYYLINILDLSECRWPRNEKFILQSENNVSLFSGIQKGEYEGVSHFLDEIINSCLTKFEPINGRRLRARFETKYLILMLLQTHASSKEHSEEAKELYYEQLQCICQKQPKHDLLIARDDFNAKNSETITEVTKTY